MDDEDYGGLAKCRHQDYDDCNQDDDEDNQDDDPPQIIDPSSSVVYMAWLIFPPWFLVAISLIPIHGPEIARRLRATKIGAARHKASLMVKIAHMRLYFPFATITAFFVPPGTLFDGFVAEKAFHTLYTKKHLQGEWYDLDHDEKKKIETKLIAAGCIVRIFGETVKRKRSFGTSGKTGGKGVVYFASFDLEKELYDAIVSFCDTNTHQEWNDICNGILNPVKVGCTAHLMGGKQDVDMSDYDSDDEEELDISPHSRGKHFIWATSHIAPTKYTAYNCEMMLYEEKLLHNKHRAKWVRGEWFNLTDDVISTECNGKDFIKGSWKRKRLGGVPNIEALDIAKWTANGLVTSEEGLDLLDRGQLNLPKK